MSWSNSSPLSMIVNEEDVSPLHLWREAKGEVVQFLKERTV